MPNWTKEQKQAIYKNNSNILVAAAAGSGKTAVLVERMINKIINEKIDIDKILIVTFTNAAASEMRERILNAIYEKLDENPEDENLQRQLTLLNLANISTIDSFCLEIVKNNFYELDNISPNFRIADTTEIDIIKEEVLEEIFEEKYETEEEDFATLINTYTSYRDDTPLKDLIKKIYQYISSNPFPKEWLHEKIEMFNLQDKNLINKDFKETIWGEELLNEIKEELQDDIIILEDLKQMLSQDEELEPCFQIIQNDIDQIQNLNNNLYSWDTAYQASQNLKFKEWTRKKIKPEIKDEAKKIRDLVKDKLNKKRDKILITDSKQATQDIYSMYSTLSKLEKLILEFDQKFTNKKREKNIVDFTDIEHFALQILIKNENGKISKTEIAKKYTEKFEEIAIDEYQDSNKVQEYILTSISKGNNIFMVGDVKQSIYKFRQAMPELFLEKYKTYTQDEASSTGTKIQLFKNFRSRSNVLEFTNLIFENIMSEKLGDVEYTEEEYLNLGATDYEQNQQNLQTQITIINTNQEEKYISEEQEDEEEIEEEHLEDIEIEAKYISTEIKNLIDSKYQIYDRKNKKFKNIEPKDIVILLRSTKDKATIYEQELTKNNLPVFSDSTQEYLETVEIQTIISLLKLIDNPLQDIPLITVLRSPICGFTDDDLVQIRLTDKNENYFYECMQKAKLNVDDQLKTKIQLFEKNIEQWRTEQEYLALDELIWKIYIDTGYYNYVGLMPNGAQRQANLKILFERAKQYETSSFKGLYNFINFIERLKSTNSDLGPAKIVGENDNVIRIMSIHKSKGLEFPVVFLANSNKQFNKQDIKNDKVLLHQKYGIGPQYIDYNMQIRYDTLARQTVKNKIEIENLSEEMRILYVALTRAKEKIYITSTEKNTQQKLDTIQKQVNIYKKENGKINPILLKKCNSYLDWILLVNEYNKNQTKEIANLKMIEKEKFLKELKQQEEKPEQIDLEEKLKIKNYKSQKEIATKIKEEIEYEYPHKATTKLPTKMSVSEIKQLKTTQDIQEPEYKLKEPQFIDLDETKPLTGAQKGSIMHLCMQKLDTNKGYTLEQLKQFIQELYETNIINQKEMQSIQLNKLYNYTKTPIWHELKTAKLIQREKPFYIELPAKEIYNQDIEGEILVQGVIDLYYINQKDELILLDYKTDYTQSEQELIDKYKIQLEIYKKALEKSLNRKVDKTYIYSLYLQKICDII